MKDKPKTALFPGSFNPFTIGHARMVERALTLFDKIVIAIGINDAKQGEGSIEERVGKISAFYQEDERVEVMSYASLTVDLVHQVGACCILRGVRNMRDFEYERDMADWNMRLAGVETLCLFSEPEYASISSSVLKDLQKYGKDISPYIAEK